MGTVDNVFSKFHFCILAVHFVHFTQMGRAQGTGFRAC